MWTKREFPTERVDKLMETIKPFPTSLPTLIHPLTTFRRIKQRVVSKRLRRNNNNLLILKRERLS